MTIVDSVGWLAFFKGEALARQYRPHLLRHADVLCPTVVLYEVCRHMEVEAGRQAAATVAAQLLRAQVVPLDAALATSAARVGIAHRLAMADAIIYATALAFQAELVTSDAHFQGLPLVTYYPLQRARS
ncbi:MAG: type II toxin-antitoxin system VapC family toxin [Armatimonadota bacterium]